MDFSKSEQVFNIFISSPSDVSQERMISHQVIENLMHDPTLREKVNLRSFAWDKKDASVPMLAHLTPQEAIELDLPKPSDCDIVVVILWGRMGTKLNGYIKEDGSTYLSGTEYEYLNAINATRQSSLRPPRPQVLVYRRDEEPVISLRDPLFTEKHEQWELVEAFFKNFSSQDGTIRTGYNVYSTPDDYRSKLEIHLKTIIYQLMKSPRPTPLILPMNSSQITVRRRGSPFPGLRAFTAEDAPIYFGRGKETDELIALMANPSCHFLCVVGSSGSGKSSLVGAGLLPRLAENAIEGSKDWISGRCSPGQVGNNPFVAFAAALIAAAPAVKDRWVAEGLAEILQADPQKFTDVLTIALTDPLADKAGQPSRDWRELLMFIDQFEELFTITAERYRQDFVDLLQIATAQNRFRIVATLRADFYYRCVEIPQLAQLLRSGSYPLSAPEIGALQEMITRPADRVGLIYEEGLAGRILTDTGSDPGALALMAYLLEELYQFSHRRLERTLTFEAYNKLGGVRGAIGTRAQTVFDNLDASAQETIAAVFRELVEVNDNGIVTRQRASLHKITHGNEKSAAQRLIDALTQARLLVLSKGINNDEPTVEIAHEALLVSWPLLQRQIEDMRDDLFLFRQLKVAARDWERSGKKREFLWKHERLIPVYDMLNRLSNPTLEPMTQIFIRSEQEWLIEEIEEIDTEHTRRLEIGYRLQTIGDYRRGVGLRPDNLPDIVWCPVEGGTLTMLEFSFEIKAFYIAKFTITHAQFESFVADHGYDVERWWEGLHRRESAPQDPLSAISNFPRDSVRWVDAMAFTRWLNEQYKQQQDALPPGVSLERGWEIRLPTEWEWQQAATSGNPTNIYPWGATWDSRRANTMESRLAQPTSVGMYPQGATPSGAQDLSGSICEWCLNEFDTIAKIDFLNDAERVRRGGSCNHFAEGARNDHRYGFDPKYSAFRHEFGFRIVLAHTLE